MSLFCQESCQLYHIKVDTLAHQNVDAYIGKLNNNFLCIRVPKSIVSTNTVKKIFSSFSFLLRATKLVCPYGDNKLPLFSGT